MLSNKAVKEAGLLKEVRVGWRAVGIVHPVPQIPVGKEVPAQEGCKGGKRPPQPGTQGHDLQHQDGDQCCPNLRIKGVLRGSDERLDPQVLLEGLEDE